MCLIAAGKVDQGAARIEINREILVYAASSDASFRTWTNTYHYDNTLLDAKIVEVKDTDEWRRKKITFNGTDNQRAIAYLYLPKNYPGPAQVVNIVPAPLSPTYRNYSLANQTSGRSVLLDEEKEGGCPPSFRLEIRRLYLRCFRSCELVKR